MKNLLYLMLLVFISCEPEVKYQDLTVDYGDESLREFESLRFDPQVEMMIMFLWPKNLGPQHQEEVMNIISRSETIFKNKQLYLNNLYSLQAEYNQNECSCHVDAMCDDDQVMDDDMFLVCLDITTRQDDNNMLLVGLYEDYEFIKSQLMAMNAINIDIGVDDDPIDIGSYDPQTGVMKLNKFIYKNYTGPVTAILAPYRADIMKVSMRINLGTKEFITGDIGVTDAKYNTIFSGEIENASGQRGLIYWEQLK
jgi:hypothetical protein